MCKIKSEQKIIDCIFVFILCFLPRFFISLKAYPVIYGSDEISSISIAAKLAGYDWSDVVSNAGYYGIGFLWIFAGLFKLNLSPVIIYRIVLSILSFVNALTGPIYYIIMQNYLNVKSRIWRLLIASICGSCMFLYTNSPNIHNEEIAVLLVSLVVYLLCRIVEKRNVKDEILLILVLLYSLTCHTRLIAVSLTVLAIGILYYIFYKKRLLHAFTYIIFIVGAAGVNTFLSLYRSSIWTDSSVRNSSVTSTVTNSLNRITKSGDYINKIGDWFKIVVGQVYTATTLTGGLFLIATVVCLIIIFKWLRKKEWKLVEQKINECQAIIATFSLVLIYMTIAAMGLTWLPGVYNAIQTYGTEVYVDNYRAFSYVRYFGIYIPPLIMLAFSYIETHKEVLKKGSLISIFVYVGLLCGWVGGILPYITSSIRPSFYFLGDFNNAEQISEGWFRICLLGVIFMLVWLFLRKRKHIEFTLMCCLGLVICEQIYTFDNSTQASEINVYNKADAGTALIQEIKDIIDKDIYVCDLSEATNHQIFYIYQFMNFTFHIIPGLPEDTGQNFILFTNAQVEDLENEDILGWQLDSNEYVYTNVLEFQKGIVEALQNTSTS